MELEELKSNWLKMSQELENQKGLTSEIILKMVSQRSNSIFNSILNFEKLEITLSSVILLYIFSNFGKLTDWLSLVGGFSTSIILAIGVVMSVMLIKRIQNVDIMNKDYLQTLLGVKRIKKFQYWMKLISAILAPVLAFSILPTFAATWFDKSLLYELEEYWESLIPSLLLIPAIWYLISKFYTKKLNQIDEMLEDLE